MASTTSDPSTKDRVNPDPQRAFLQSIDATFETTQSMAPTAPLAGDEAREAAARHIVYVARLNSEAYRRHALGTMADIAELSPDYREYVIEHSRSTMVAAESAKAHIDLLSAAKDDRIAIELGSERDRSERWQLIESVPAALMRSNHDAGVVEVQEAGSTIALPNLAAIDQWCEAHDASNTDKERLVALGIVASRERELHPHSSSQHLTNEAPATMESTQENQRQPIVRIGSNMPKPDWQEAINLLKSQSPETRGHVYLPKAEGEYGGRVMLITDTHIVQRVGRGVAVAHDLNHLDNGPQLTAAIDAGTLRPGAHMKIQYGQDRGQAAVIPFNQQRAEEMQRDLTAWADKNITNAKGRETFLKHVAAAAKDLGQSRSEPTRPGSSAQPRERTHAPQRDR